VIKNAVSSRKLLECSGLPALQWVKINGFSSWLEIQSAAVEVDRELKSLPIAEAARGVPDPLDLRVQPLGHGIGDPMIEVVENVLEMAPEECRRRGSLV
jgi:hypothetical protein